MWNHWTLKGYGTKVPVCPATMLLKSVSERFLLVNILNAMHT
jgi:hypothetical protein